MSADFFCSNQSPGFPASNIPYISTEMNQRAIRGSNLPEGKMERGSY